MNKSEFQSKAQALLEELDNLIGKMPQKGNTAEECQKIYLNIKLSELEAAS